MSNKAIPIIIALLFLQLLICAMEKKDGCLATQPMFLKRGDKFYRIKELKVLEEENFLYEIILTSQVRIKTNRPVLMGGELTDIDWDKVRDK